MNENKRYKYAQCHLFDHGTHPVIGTNASATAKKLHIF